jgi:hypothetical protein
MIRRYAACFFDIRPDTISYGDYDDDDNSHNSGVDDDDNNSGLR